MSHKELPMSMRLKSWSVLNKLARAGIESIAARTVLLTLVCLLTSPVRGSELIYQEGFNDDGEKANPPRYTTIGRDVYTLERIQNELDPTGALGQLGAIYWGHNFELPNSFVGVPGPTPARRMIFPWDPGNDV